MSGDVPPADEEWWREAEKRAEAEIRRYRRGVRRGIRWRRSRRLLGPVVVLALLAAGGAYYLRDGRDSHIRAAKVPTPVLRVTAAPPRIHLSDPFGSTLAEHYPDGAAGIVLPPARAVGDLSAATVAADLAATKRLLVLSRLDPRMLVRRDPSAFLAALAPNEQATDAKLFDKKPTRGALCIASRLAPGSTLLPATPKVTGSMSYQAGKTGQLTVHTKFVFVYPLRPDEPDLLATQQELLVVVRAEVDFLFVHGERYRPGDRGVFIGHTDGFDHNADCDTAHSGLLSLPRGSDSVLPLDPVHYDTRDFYDPTRPMPQRGNCPPG